MNEKSKYKIIFCIKKKKKPLTEVNGFFVDCDCLVMLII